jgi:hypothetical protein
MNLKNNGFIKIPYTPNSNNFHWGLFDRKIPITDISLSNEIVELKTVMSSTLLREVVSKLITTRKDYSHYFTYSTDEFKLRFSVTVYNWEVAFTDPEEFPRMSIQLAVDCIEVLDN